MVIKIRRIYLSGKDSLFNGRQKVCIFTVLPITMRTRSHQIEIAWELVGSLQMRENKWECTAHLAGTFGSLGAFTQIIGDRTRPVSKLITAGRLRCKRTSSLLLLFQCLLPCLGLTA